jgi:hypothetical protein
MVLWNVVKDKSRSKRSDICEVRMVMNMVKDNKM